MNNKYMVVNIRSGMIVVLLLVTVNIGPLFINNYN